MFGLTLFQLLNANYYNIFRGKISNKIILFDKLSEV